MKKRQIERWATQFTLPALPGFVARGDLLFAAPVELIHRVILLESSPSDPTVFSHIFVAVMPLWTPFPVTSLTYSIDLLYPDRDAQGPVRAENAANVFAKIGRLIRLRAPEVFDRIGTPELFLRNCRNLFVEQAGSKGADTSFEQLDHLPLTQDLAGAAVLVGDTAEAVRFAERFIRTFEKEDNPYFQEQVNGMRRLAKLAVDDLPGARRLLQEWERHTIGQLKLEAFLDPNRWARFGVPLVNDEGSRSLDASAGLAGLRASNARCDGTISGTREH